MSNSISEETRGVILEAAWQLMHREGRLDVTQTEIAAAAGVSRQTIFYAFGGRGGLLLAMVRHQDERTDHVPRLVALVRGTATDVATLESYIDVWLEYLPIIYPVAIQLEMSADRDPDAAAAFADRLVGALRGGFETLLRRLADAKAIPASADPSALADLALGLVLPSAWRFLVVERGWTASAFAESRKKLIRAAIQP
jgi:AcrR family transcriptional regulator